MEQRQLKQRIIGAVVLISLVVIFLPMLLNGPEDATEQDIEIPPRPAELTDSLVIADDEQLHTLPSSAAPIQHQVIESVEQPVSSEVPGQSVAAPPASAGQPTSQPSEPPVVLATSPAAQEPAVTTWDVQVGSFSNRANALELRDRLRKQKFTAYVDEQLSGATRAYRVRVGPVLEIEQAEQLKKQIKSQAKLDGMVMRHR